MDEEKLSTVVTASAGGGVATASGGAQTETCDRVKARAVFLLGLPRSGTTLLGYLLAGGSSVLSLSEPYLAHSIFGERRLRRFFARLQKKADLKRSVPPRKSQISDFLAYLTELATQNGLDNLVVKETFRSGREWDNVDLMNEIASGSHPIACVTRHPYDVAVSSIRFCKWWRGVVGHLIRLWAPGMPLIANDTEVVRHMSQNWSTFSTWCSQNKLYVVRYEDLVNDPVDRLRGICEHVGLEFDERMLDHHHPRGPFGGIGDPGVMGRSPRPIDVNSIGRKSQLAPELQQLVAEHCASGAAEMGYSL